MSTATFDYLTAISTLTILTCPSCGVRYAIPEIYRAKRLEDGKSWHCPNGHSLSYHETEADKLRKQLEEEQKRTRYAQHQVEQERTRVRGLKIKVGKVEAAKKRIEDRVHAGVCPCCTRSFANLRRHMATQHSDDPRAAVELEKLNAAKELVA